MFHMVQSFLDDYGLESKATQQLLDSLNDASMSQEVAPGFRTLGELALHLIPSKALIEPMGLQAEIPLGDGDKPGSAAEVAAAYRTASRSLLDAVRTQWTDGDLQQSTNLFGQIWKNGLTLYVLVKHEIHHRGQLTVLMRQAGLPVIGIYGPSKEGVSLL